MEAHYRLNITRQQISNSKTGKYIPAMIIFLFNSSILVYPSEETNLYMDKTPSVYKIDLYTLSSKHTNL